MKISAIYKILNIHTGHMYIGSSKDIKRRYKNHKYHCNVSGKNNPMFGKKLLGYKNPMFGRHHTEETKKKISETKRCRRKESVENVKDKSSECKSRTI